MEKGKLPGDWNTVKEKIQSRWDKITDEELDQINGSRDELMSRIVEHYDMDEDKAKLAVEDFERNLDQLNA